MDYRAVASKPTGQAGASPMIEIAIPGWKALRLQHLVLDVNGTLTLDGRLLDGVSERIKSLAPQLGLHLLSADTFGRLDSIAASLGVDPVRLLAGEPEQTQKAEFVRGFGGEVAAMGNGANDVLMLQEADLGIAVMGPEGAAPDTLLAADLVVHSSLEGPDLLINPKRLIATLRR
jgi:P-type E1-E2 ATPase